MWMFCSVAFGECCACYKCYNIYKCHIEINTVENISTFIYLFRSVLEPDSNLGKEFAVD